MPEYKAYPEHRYWMVQQVWESLSDRSVYSRLGEFELSQMKEFLPPNPKTVLEIGCGLGRGSINLNWHYNDPNIFWVLGDKTEDVTVNTGQFGANEAYNDLRATESFCALNGLTNFSVLSMHEGWELSTHPVDLVVSFCSFGVHVPIESVMDKLLRLASPDVTMIFGTREYYDETSFADKFKEVIFRRQPHENPFPHQNWLVLRGVK